MDEDEVPNFRSRDEEMSYWKKTALALKSKVDELERELVEFQDSSSQLEKELEKSLEHADKTNRDLKTKCNKLTLDLDSYRVSLNFIIIHFFLFGLNSKPEF